MDNNLLMNLQNDILIFGVLLVGFVDSFTKTSQ